MEEQKSNGYKCATNYKKRFRESKDQKKEDQSKKLAVDSGKVSSNIRHGGCGDVDLGCIPVGLVVYMRTCICLSVNTTYTTQIRFPVKQMYITHAVKGFNPLSSR